jgi:LysM repeat protein
MLAWLGVLLLSGCQPSQRSDTDEQREPHFMNGKSRVISTDYAGAIAAYQRALEVNPQSASAHFELAWLYDEKIPDPAAAIYHYGRYLELQPNAGNSETVRSRILAKKQELASTVTLSPVTKTLQDELHKAMELNRSLRDQVESWKAYARGLEAITNSLAANRPASNPVPEQPNLSGQPRRSDTGSARGAGEGASPVAGGTPRTHEVKSGETPTSIARKYGVKLDALMAANPRLDARRMRAGQTLVIPPVPGEKTVNH